LGLAGKILASMRKRKEKREKNPRSFPLAKIMPPGKITKKDSPGKA